MSIDELREWQAFDSVSPIGDYRTDLNFAVLAQQIAYWSGHCKEVPSLKELLAVDPLPLTNEQQAAENAAQDAERSKAYTESLIATLKSKANRK